MADRPVQTARATAGEAYGAVPAKVDLLRRALRGLVPTRLRPGLRPYADALATCEELVRLGHVKELLSVLSLLTGDPALGSSARQLLRACQQLQRSGLLEETTPARRVIELLRVTAAEDGDLNEPDGVLVRRYDGADTALLFFNPLGGYFWVSLGFTHHFLRSNPWHLVYLRDFRECFHMAGISGLADDYPHSVDALRRLLARLGARRVYCMGHSAGGYAALRYGLDLGAEAVVAFSAPTNLAAVPEIYLRTLRATAPRMAVDLLPLYEAARRVPRLLLYYGADNAADRDAATRMDRFPGVELKPVAGCETHNTMAYFMINRRFDGVIEALNGNGRS